MTPETIADEWIMLFDMANRKPVNAASFKTLHDTVASKYRKLSLEQQGEFTALIIEKRGW